MWTWTQTFICSTIRVLLSKWSHSGTSWRSGHTTHLSWSAAFIRGSAQKHSWLLTDFLSAVWLHLWIQMIFKSSHFYSICLCFLSCLKGRKASVLVFDGLITVCGSKPTWNTAAARQQTLMDDWHTVTWCDKPHLKYFWEIIIKNLF